MKTYILAFLMDKYYLFFDKGYTLLGKDKVCKSVNGDFGVFCGGTVDSMNGCKAKCSSQTSCVAFNFYSRELHWNNCYVLSLSVSLLVSEYECPSGFTFHIHSRKVTSTKDLVVVRDWSSQGASCYGKNLD